MVAAFQYYVIIYYVFGGDTVAGAEYAGYAGTIAAMTTFAVIPLVTRLSTTYEKESVFLFHWRLHRWLSSQVVLLHA